MGSHIGPQERMQLIVNLARRLAVDGDESVRDDLRNEIETLDAIERRLDEVFESWNRDPLTGDQLNR